MYLIFSFGFDAFLGFLLLQLLKSWPVAKDPIMPAHVITGDTPRKPNKKTECVGQSSSRKCLFGDSSQEKTKKISEWAKEETSAWYNISGTRSQAHWVQDTMGY